MGNGFHLSVRHYPAFASKPWKVEIPASLTGDKRKRLFFEDKGKALEWVEAFRERALSRGVAYSLGPDSVTVRQAMRQFMDAKLEVAGTRQRQSLILMERRILERFGGLGLEGITPVRVEGWLGSYGWSKRTQFNAFSYLRTFMRWCVRRGMIERNPIDVLAEEIRKPPAPKVTISAGEMALLLHLTKRDGVLRAAVVLGGFAGIRTDEIRKLDWGDCDWEDGEVHVPPHAIKKTEARGGMRERYVRMLPVFLAYVPRGGRGPVVPTSTAKSFYNRRAKLLPRMRRLMARLNMPNVEKWRSWPDNCLRHTYASALLMVTKNAWTVAHELGHENTKTIHRDYARAMKEREALRYLSLGLAEGVSPIPRGFGSRG